MNVAQIKERFRGASYSERVGLLGKILREARDTDVCAFTSPDEVRQLWPEVCIHLGRRRAFWEFLFTRWQIVGFLIGDDLIPPGGISVQELRKYLDDLVARLSRLAFPKKY